MYTKCGGVAAYLYHNYIVLCVYVKGVKLLNIYLQITRLFRLRVFYYAYHVVCIGRRIKQYNCVTDMLPHHRTWYTYNCV